MQDCGSSSALAIKLLQSCSKPSICFVCEVFRSYLRPHHYQSSWNNESPNFHTNHNICHIVIHITTTSTMDRDKDCGITKSRGFRDAFHQWFISLIEPSHRCVFVTADLPRLHMITFSPNKVSDYELILLDHGPVEILRHGSIVCV